MHHYHHALLIVNPASGRSDPQKVQQTIEARLAAEHVACEMRITQNEGDAFAWAKEAHEKGHNLVIVAGGDGTIMEAMSGLIKSEHKVPLAQVPTGTANLLAAALKIPSDVEGALDTIFEGKAVSFDVGYLPDEDRYFALIAGAGYDARLIADASRELKNMLGFGAYLLTGIKNLFKLHPAQIDLEIDGRHRRIRAHTVMIINVGQIESVGLTLGPDIDLHDGKLDLMIISTASVWGAVRTLLRILTGRFYGHPDIEYVKASHVTLTSRPSLPTQIDGEPLGTTPLRAEAVSNGALLIVPASYEDAVAKDH